MTGRPLFLIKGNGKELKKNKSPTEAKEKWGGGGGYEGGKKNAEEDFKRLLPQATLSYDFDLRFAKR